MSENSKRAPSPATSSSATNPTRDAQPQAPMAVTERTNPRTAAIDAQPSLGIVTLINDEDATVAPAVRRELGHIAQAVDIIVERLQRGGRLFYFGAGTSGRLGVLDASEMPPTFGVSSDLVQGHIAGGDVALRQPIEGAEDDTAAGAHAVQQVGMTEADVVVGIAASGTTPWVLGVVNEARRLGTATVALTCAPDSPLARAAAIAIAPAVGPEVIAGSSRMKAGTAQKMVLNMLSTATMIRLGKVYGNLMVDVRPTNAKLRRRAIHILQEAADADAETARRTLEATGYEVKPALVMLLADVDANQARHRLAIAGGFVRRAIQQASSVPADPGG
jgi:N-acetylmuramic acid 6-phosphate etherase